MNENMFPLDSTPDYETNNIVSNIIPNDETGNIVSDCTSLDDYSSSKGVLLLARAFLSIDSMTHKKLQKLCFYAKAWYLALYDENIIIKIDVESVGDEFKISVKLKSDESTLEKFKSQLKIKSI